MTNYFHKLHDFLKKFIFQKTIQNPTYSIWVGRWNFLIDFWISFTFIRRGHLLYYELYVQYV